MFDYFPYEIVFVLIACEGGTYGAGCKEACGYCRDGNQCSNINGTCLTGCDTGFKGDFCKTGKCVDK